MKTAARSALATFAAASALALAFSAQAQPRDQDRDRGRIPACFLTRDIRNHTVMGDRTMFINVRGRDVYRVEMSNNCLAAVSSSDPFVLRDRTNSGRICHRLDFDIRVRGTPCIVDSITRLTPQEIAALPRGARP